MKNKQQPDAGVAWVVCTVAVIFAVAVIAVAIHEKLIAAPALAVANENGDAKARLAFQSWRALTEQNGTAITWSGKTAEVILVTRKEFKDRTSWNILARSEGGRYFEVWAEPTGEHLTMQITSGTKSVQELDESEVVRLLTAADRIDLIQKLNLPLKPA